MKILFIRGGFLNEWETQNYLPLLKDFDITFVSSKYPLTSQPPPKTVTFWSVHDVCVILARFGSPGVFLSKALAWITRRTTGDTQYLHGLDEYVQKTGPYDIAHIAESHYGYCRQAARLKSEGLVRSIITTCWETKAHNNESTAAKRSIKREVKKAVDIYFTPTDRARKALLSEGVRPRDIKVVRMGVNSGVFSSPSRQKKDEKELHVLFVGRLVREKGVYDLLSAYDIAYKNLAVKGIHTSLTLVGAGPEKRSIERILQNKEDRDVKIISREYESIAREYGRSDVIVVPSLTTKTWEEQYGMVLVEAMASGLPIVAYVSGAIPEVVGDAGVPVSEGDVDGLAQVLTEMGEDPYLRKKYGRQARARYEKEFDLGMTSKQIAHYYKSFEKS